ncbi:MAG TPA: hypothetical protein VGX78_22705 [Pirellulales bacterium]|nr:hypothetical protein [Pirellulales bacterium]
MRRYRFNFNLLTLFGFVAVVAVACAALARPSQLWLVVVSALSQASLFYAVLAAAYGRNARRAFWFGFAVVGWGYVVLEWAGAAGLPFFAPTAFVTDRLQTLLHAQPTLPTPNYASWSKTPPGAPVPVWNVDDAPTDGTSPELAHAPADNPTQASDETERSEPEAEPIPVDAQPADRQVAAEPGAIAKPSAGPGMIMLGEPGGVVPKMQMFFAGPDGMVVAWEVAPGQFDSEPLTCPGRYKFPVGAIYRLKLTHIPGREGIETYAFLEVSPAPLPRTEAYVANNAVPVEFTEEDFDQVMAGRGVTKVIFLPDPEFQDLALDGVGTIVSTRLDPGVDPVIEADRRGGILAIVQMGSDADAYASDATASDLGNGAALPPGLGAGMWGAMFLTFGIACSATFIKEYSMRLGVLSSLWCGMMYAAVLVACALAIGFTSMPHMQGILAPLYRTSGMQDPQAFVVRHEVGAAGEHLLLVPAIASFVGLVSGVACLFLNSMRRQAALVIIIVAMLVFAAGVGSIRFATSLERSQRPPFVVLGLAALAVTLASAHPLLIAIRHPRSPREPSRLP